VTTNVTAKPVTFLHESNNGCIVILHMQGHPRAGHCFPCPFKTGLR